VTSSSRADGALVVLGRNGTGSWVERRALVDRLCTETRATVVLLTGPAGAGKTTVAKQWAAAESRPHQHLPLAAHLDDPAVLADAVVTVLEAVGPPEPLARALVTGQEPTFSSVVLPGLAALMASRATPYVLVLDDVHLLRHADCVRLVRTLADAVPSGSALALLSRGSAPSWLARLRAEQRVLELASDALAFDADEVEALLASLGVGLAPAERDWLLQRTEGWAVALYLEALALRQPGSFVPRQGAARAAHDPSLMRDYIEAEILDSLPGDTRDFLLRTAILDDLDPASCDALLDRTDSAAVLDGLRRATPLVTLVDADRWSYRYHHLLRDTLNAILVTSSAASALADLRGRAARMYASRGDVDAAVRHSSRSGDVDATADLIWPQVVASLTTGMPDRLARWLEDLPPSDVTANPWLSQAAAWSALQAADQDLMQRWILRSESHAGRGWRARVSTEPYAASLATLEAIVGQVELRDAADLCVDAMTGLRPDDPLRSAAAFIGAVCLTLLRDPDAVPLLLEAEGLARALDVPLVEADALSWRGVLSVLGGDVVEGTRLIFEASSLIADHELVRLATSAHCITAQALAHALRQDHDRAAIALATSRRLTLAAEGIAPWFHVCGRLVQARAALILGDGALARLLLTEARSAMTPDLARSAAQEMIEAAEEVLSSTAARGGSMAPLTAAEVRVLQFLPSHLTFPQIGEHLFLSGNTVKTHALSIYRKLGVASRHDAVTSAQVLGLVEAPMRA